MSSQNFDTLTALMEQVSTHPTTLQAVVQAEKRDTFVPSLTDTVWLDNQTPEYQKLIGALVEYLCEEFITNQGGNSSSYYEAKRQGFKLRVGESDSFGPLSCVLTSSNYNWRVMYG